MPRDATSCVTSGGGVASVRNYTLPTDSVLTTLLSQQVHKGHLDPLQETLGKGWKEESNRVPRLSSG